jgi:hypothetical protein
MKRILIIIIFLPVVCSAQKFQYGVEVGYGIDKAISEVTVYEEYNEKYKDLYGTGSKIFFDYLGMWHTEGKNFRLSGFVDYIPIKWVKFRSGVGISMLRGEFLDYGSEHRFPYDYSYYKLTYLTVPLELVLLDNCWIKPYVAFNSSIRAHTSKNMKNTFTAWEKESNSDDFNLHAQWFKFDYELGVKLQIWKAELSISKYTSLNPLIVIPEYYENKPDGTVNPSEGETAHFNTGLKFKLSVPIGEFELK